MTALDAIVARKKSELQGAAAPAHLEPSSRSFVASLRTRRPSLIAEVKLRSPSAGPLIERDAVPSVVAAYDRHAQAISVLCDAPDFGGGYDLLADVRSMTNLPILAKEFIVDPLQIRLARAAGADAILLIGAILSRGDAQLLAATAYNLGMHVLFEIHEPADLDSVPELPASHLVIGINNRDLRTLGTDTSVTRELAPLVRDMFGEHLLLSESGIRTRADTESLSAVVDGFLIGETFLRSPDIASTLHMLFPS